ncbi:hypothetical protein DIS24_g2784 [Lasiodiplodia hormozganensis]|uniref:Cysteine-rich transmembrane CYSTM domain-containing protein n=2 Tax=Lasiodiplodia TaxID=66739 RepID=A0AA39YZ25_9PEZI|nr:hypothetical protein DIS24_g2784 [Lasiodiplodia hormozganensis]
MQAARQEGRADEKASSGWQSAVLDAATCYAVSACRFRDAWELPRWGGASVRSADCAANKRTRTGRSAYVRRPRAPTPRLALSAPATLHPVAFDSPLLSPEFIMSNQGYYGGPPPPQQAYYPQQGYPQGPPPQMQYPQQPPQTVIVKEKKDRGCLGTCLAVLCCCFVCEEGCECCAECCECAEDCC